jgi:hypothetical protein
MFSGTSKTRLIFWSFFWAALFFVCWLTDTPPIRTLALVFLIVAGVLARAAYQKAKRDAYYRQLSNAPTQPMYPPEAPNSRSFGPPPPLNQ